MDDELFLLCSCYSYEHQLFLWWDEDEKSLYAHFHLATYRGFWGRLWHGIKYAFGYKSRFGAWDQFIFDKKNLEKLNEFLLSQNK